jgi:Flp pilus assembly protein TadB
MARSSSLRASDADRDAVAERLRQAAVEGRLEPDELEERLHIALRARTYGELEPLLSDLPRRSVPRERPARTATGLMLAVAVRLVVLALIAAALITALAVSAAWWLLCVLVWLSLRTRRSCAGWHRPPPRARRVY